MTFAKYASKSRFRRTIYVARLVFKQTPVMTMIVMIIVSTIRIGGKFVMTYEN